MQIGFLRSLLFGRYGALWVQLVTELGLEPVFAQEADTLAALQISGLVEIPSISFQVAAAEAKALSDCALLIVPDLNPNADVPRGGGADPWIANFSEMLATSVAGLPPIADVPVAADVTTVEARATELLLTLSRDPARSRRAWERHSHLAGTPRHATPRFQRIPGETKTIAVVGQPWLFKEGILAALRSSLGDEVHLLLQTGLEPQTLREEGWRAEARLVPTDAECLGASRYFARRAVVDSLIVLADKRSGADNWLLSQIKKLSHKPVQAVYLQDLITADSFDSLLDV